MIDDLPDFKSGPDFIMVTKEHFAELQRAITERDRAVDMLEKLFPTNQTDDQWVSYRYINYNDAKAIRAIKEKGR